MILLKDLHDICELCQFIDRQNSCCCIIVTSNLLIHQLFQKSLLHSYVICKLFLAVNTPDDSWKSFDTKTLKVFVQSTCKILAPTIDISKYNFHVSDLLPRKFVDSVTSWPHYESLKILN